MDGMTFNWLETERVNRAHARLTHESTAVRLVRENARLVEENERLARRCADLAASAELWIQLYEAALARGEAPRGGRNP
jgi:hypothetical protein